ncbi:MAG: hypothetical protein K8R53_05160, partial [Bacteroidales bacterium]|nr:hypothetical protein [Bacteroidales bacterium]
NRQLGNMIDAKDGFGFAARSMKYRSAANTQLSEICFLEQNIARTEEYAHNSLDYNKYNLNGYKLLAVIYRIQNKKNEAEEVLAKMSELDPLNHFVRFEQYLLTPDQENLSLFTSMIRNELPQETYLELAIGYANLGLNMEAIRVLENAPSYPVVYYWLAYLYQKENSDKESRDLLEQALHTTPFLCFPFRRETIQILEWAESEKETWQSKYYMGLIYWGKGRIEEARILFTQCGNRSDFAPFYLTRGNLFKGENFEKVLLDYNKAVQMSKNKWRAYHILINYYHEIALYDKALEVSKIAYKEFADEHFIIGMDHAKTLLFNRKYKECISVLDNINILPYEGSREGHDFYRQANLLHAVELMKKGNYTKAVKFVDKCMEWPEHLGVGSPYIPDVRLENYIKALCYEQMGNEDKAGKLYEGIYKFTVENRTKWGSYHYVGAIVLRKLGKNDQATELLKEWGEAQPPDDIVANWSVAKFNNNNARAQEALESNKVKTEGTPWNPAGSDRDFPLVLEVMKLIEK